MEANSRSRLSSKGDFNLNFPAFFFSFAVDPQTQAEELRFASLLISGYCKGPYVVKPIAGKPP